MRFDGVIFDMDGTLLDTERLVIEAGQAAFAELGVTEPSGLLESFVGQTADQCLQLLRAAFGPDFDKPRFDAVWDQHVRTAFDDGIPLRPGVAELLTRIGDMGLPIIVATNSRHAPAVRNLETAGLNGHFPARRVIGRDNVPAPKPAPDMFLLAADRIEVPPARCLIFEDSDPGVAGAVAAGITVVQVPDQRPPATDAADLVAETLLDGAERIGLFG